MSKPTWLLLGGCGYVGANLITYLHKHELASTITVADLKPPGRCFFPNEFMQLFSDKVIEFVQSDFAQDAHIERLFPEGKQFDVIVDLIAETRTGYTDDVIFDKILKPSTKVLQKIITISKGSKNPPYFIEMSTSQVYDPTGKPIVEGGKCKPWTIVAKAKYEIEQLVQKAFDDNSLHGCILRPSFIYGGFNEFRSIAPRLCCAAVYQKTNEKMEFLWTKSLQINTVHINDVCRAISWVYENKKLCNHGILNLSDQGNTTQGSLNTIIENIFQIKTDFAGTIMSNLARIKLKDLTDDANDQHQPIWLALNREHGIENTPYTTYISIELLYNNPLCIDGTGITKLVQKGDKVGTPFVYEHPQISQALVFEALSAAVQRGLFPKIALSQQ
jgi:nucleoside-diphosphate-sugar epimerase